MVPPLVNASWPPPYGLIVPDVQVPGQLFGVPKAAGNMLSVAAFAENNFEGAMYIFQTEDRGLTWTQTQRLLSSASMVGSAFGVAADMHEDLLFVGSSESSLAAPGPGSVFVFRRQGGRWVEISIIRSDQGVIGAFFGIFIRRIGNSVVISAPLETNEGGVSAGAAYLFQTGDGGFTWTQVHRITDPEPGDNRAFGSVMDVDGAHLVVCSTDHDLIPGSTSYVGAGAAYVYTWPDLEYVATLKASDGQGGDQFGFGAGILNGMAVIGARRNDNQGFEDAGAIYVFSQDKNWTQINKLVRPDPHDQAYFGHNIWLRGDLMFVGSNELGVPNGDPGAVDLLRTTDGGYTWDTERSIRTDMINDFAYLNYINDDGVIFVGAPFAEVNGVISGAVFLYHLDDEFPVIDPVITEGGSSKKSSGNSTTAIVLGVCLTFGFLFLALLTWCGCRRAPSPSRVPKDEDDAKIAELKSTDTTKFGSAEEEKAPDWRDSL